MSLASAQSKLDERHRGPLSMFADVLIPGGAGLPSASQADVHGKWIDRVLNARPDLAPDLLALLEQGSGEDPRKELQRCREEMPEVFETFTLAVSGAYFMNPRVRKALGYPGTAPKRKPAYPDEADFYLDGGALVEPVVARGPIYRSTPAGESTQ